MIGSLSVYRFCSRLIQATKYAILSERAWDRVAHQKYEEAEKFIDKARAVMPNLMTEEKIKLAFIKFRLYKNSKSVHLFKEAWLSIDKNTKLSDQEKDYLKSYISTTLYEVTKLTIDNDVIYLEKFRHPIFIRKIDLSKIRKSMRKNYPMREHPEWIEP